MFEKTWKSFEQVLCLARSVEPFAHRSTSFLRLHPRCNQQMVSTLDKILFFRRKNSNPLRDDIPKASRLVPRWTKAHILLGLSHIKISTRFRRTSQWQREQPRPKNFSQSLQDFKRRCPTAGGTDRIGLGFCMIRPICATSSR